MNRGNKETQKWKTTLRKMNRNGDCKMGEQSLVCGQTNQRDSLKQNCVCVTSYACMCMVEESARHLDQTFRVLECCLLPQRCVHANTRLFKIKKGKLNTFEMKISYINLHYIIYEMPCSLYNISFK